MDAGGEGSGSRKPTRRNLGARRILVAEDDPVIRTVLVGTLRAEGVAEILECARLRAAMDLIRSTREIDVALLDLQLADGLVYPAADALIARGVPVVFLSGYDSGEVPEDYAQCRFLGKPFSTTDLLAALTQQDGGARAQPFPG